RVEFWITHPRIDPHRLRVLPDRLRVPASLLVEAAEVEVGRREPGLPRDRLAERVDRADGLAVRLPEDPEVVRREVVRVVELERFLVLIPGVLDEAALREKVSEIVAQVRRVRLLGDALLLLEDAIIERVPRNEVLPIERLARRLALRVEDAASDGRSRRHDDHRSPESLHETSRNPSTSAASPRSRVTAPSRPASPFLPSRRRRTRPPRL